MVQRQYFVGQTDETFDVVLFWIAWEFEDNDVPAFGIAQGISELADQNSIAAKRGMVLIAASQTLAW